MAASIDQLQAFIVLAETGHFSRAADRLNVSKSSLSSNIQRLEGLLGVSPFTLENSECKSTPIYLKN